MKRKRIIHVDERVTYFHISLFLTKNNIVLLEDGTQ